MLTVYDFARVINYYLPEPHASLLNGILFGIKIKSNYIFYEQVKITGLLHLVVLSGINITILGSIIASFTVFFSKKISIMITILVIILFVFFVGAEAPIIRAAFMGILTLVSVLLGRKNYPLFALFLSFIFILIFFPAWIKTISLQLSYAATLGIILFGQEKFKKSTSLTSKIWFFLKQQLRPTMTAQLFTIPIILLYFKEISLIAPLSNFLISEFVPILMIFGFLTATLGKINLYLGFFPAWICYLILSYMVLIIETLAKIPGVYIKF